MFVPVCVCLCVCGKRTETLELTECEAVNTASSTWPGAVDSGLRLVRGVSGRRPFDLPSLTAEEQPEALRGRSPGRLRCRIEAGALARTPHLSLFFRPICFSVFPSVAALPGGPLAAGAASGLRGPTCLPAGPGGKVLAAWRARLNGRL